METAKGHELTEELQPKTFDEIYAAYAERVLNLAYRLTGDAECSRDLCQEVFIKVHQHLAGFEQRSQVYTWIYRIAVNHIRNYLKRERRRRWIDLMDKNISDVVRERDVDPAFWGRVVTPSSGVERSQRAMVVWKIIQTLDPKYRVPLVLHHYDELSYKEIADAMQLSISAVESRIHRAKKQLIKKLEPWVDKI